MSQKYDVQGTLVLSDFFIFETSFQQLINFLWQ